MFTYSTIWVHSGWSLASWYHTFFLYLVVIFRCYGFIEIVSHSLNCWSMYNTYKFHLLYYNKLLVYYYFICGLSLSLFNSHVIIKVFYEEMFVSWVESTICSNYLWHKRMELATWSNLQGLYGLYYYLICGFTFPNSILMW